MLILRLCYICFQRTGSIDQLAAKESVCSKCCVWNARQTSFMSPHSLVPSATQHGPTVAPQFKHRRRHRFRRSSQGAPPAGIAPASMTPRSPGRLLRERFRSPGWRAEGTMARTRASWRRAGQGGGRSPGACSRALPCCLQRPPRVSGEPRWGRRNCVWRPADSRFQHGYSCSCVCFGVNPSL